MQQDGIFGLGPTAGHRRTADAETSVMRERLAVVEREVKYFRSEMQSEGIEMTGIKFVSLVGTSDGVVPTG